jgi:hypothetical protein
MAIVRWQNGNSQSCGGAPFAGVLFAFALKRGALGMITRCVPARQRWVQAASALANWLKGKHFLSMCGYQTCSLS